MLCCWGSCHGEACVPASQLSQLVCRWRYGAASWVWATEEFHSKPCLGIAWRVLAELDQNLARDLSTSLRTYTIPVSGCVAWKCLIYQYWHSFSVFWDTGTVLFFINLVKRFITGNSMCTCYVSMKYCMYSWFILNLCVCWALMTIDGQIFPNSVSGTRTAIWIW